MGQKSTQTVETKGDPWVYQQQQALYRNALGDLGGTGGKGTMQNPYQEQVASGLGQFADPGSFFSGNISTFMDPYTESVIDAQRESTLRGAEETRQRLLGNLTQQGGAAGAFGERGQIAQGQFAADVARDMAAQEAQLRSQGFNQASRNLLATGGLGLSGLSQLGQFGQQQAFLPIQQYGLLGGLLRGTQGTQTNTQTMQGSPWSTVLGLGGLAGGLLTGGG